MKINYLKRYREYLKSDHWARLKVESSERWGGSCYVCSKSPVDFHHIAYRNLTDCSADDVIPLCRACHKGAHFSPGGLARRLKVAASNNQKRAIIREALRGTFKTRSTEAQRDFEAYKQRVELGKKTTLLAIREERRQKAIQDVNAIKPMPNETRIQTRMRLKQERRLRVRLSRIDASVRKYKL